MGDRNEKLMSDVKVLVSDAGGLIKASTREANDKLAQLEAAAVERARLAAEKARAAAEATDDYVHLHPWTAIGLAAGAGLVLGVLIGRR